MTTYVKAADIAADVKARAQGITIANDFETDIGTKVMMGRRKIPADDELPCMIVLEGPDDPQEQGARATRVKIAQTYILDAFDVCDPDNPNDKAHAMIRDMKRAIYADGKPFGDKVIEVEYLGRDIGPRPDGAATVQARIAIRVVYAEDLSTP